MNTASQNRLKKVHPELARRAALLIQALADKGYTIEVVQGLRTFAEQDELYKTGPDQTGSGCHQG
jgi:LAS superfamily LD-carboxypeptidase LdcB